MDLVLQHSEALATIVSVVVVAIAGVIGFRADQQRHRREYTLNVISPLLTDNRLFEAHNIIIDYHVNKRRIDYNNITDENKVLILQLLGYYEFLAASFLRKDLDRETVLCQSKSSIRNTYDVVKAFIESRRVMLSRPNVYAEFELLATQYCNDTSLPSDQ
ncbi:MAG: hypothetical protein P8Y67_07915 [Alphaproteobacteria bacterium]